MHARDFERFARLNETETLEIEVLLAAVVLRDGCCCAIMVCLRGWSLGVEFAKHFMFQTRLSALQPSNVNTWAPAKLVPFVDDTRNVLL